MARPLHPALLLLLGLSSTVAAAPPHVTPPRPAPPAPAPTDVMRVHFIDVGQGAATLVELPCGAMLVDTGGEDLDDGTFHSNAALAAYLDAFFARRTDLHRTLDLLLLTHPHIDHVRGAEEVLRDYTVRNYVDNGQTPDLDLAVDALQRAHAVLDAHPEIHTQTVSTADFGTDGQPITSPVIDPFPSCRGVDPSVEALWGYVHSDPGWGDDDYGKPRYANQNNHSIVTRVDFGEASLLITGDLETVAIDDLLHQRPAKALDADIYEVGHHGSYNGTTAALLDAITPEWAVVEVGPFDRHEPWTAWQHGHPREATIELLEHAVTGSRPPVDEEVASGVKSFSTMQIDKAIYATGWDGTVVLQADAQGHIVRGAPDGVARGVSPTLPPAPPLAIAPAPASSPAPGKTSAKHPH